MLLAIDIGTSSVKAIVFDVDKAAIRAIAAKEYSVSRPQPNYAEQDPDVWWRSTVSVIRQVVQEPDLKHIQAIGLTGQMHGTVLLDESHTVLHPAIIWADQRSADALATIADTIGEEAFSQVTGTLPATGFMAATLVWLKQNNPQLLDRASHVLLPKDYVRFRLTGQIATDVSDAASAALLNVRDGVWADDIIDKLDLDPTLFPDILPSAGLAGHLTPSAAQEIGLPSGIPIAAGCADQPSQAIANGLTKPGLASVTIGTGGQVFAPIDMKQKTSLPTDKRLHVFNHALGGQVYVLGAILSAGSALRWLRGITGLSSNPDAYAILSQEASGIAPGSDGLIFLPYLVGERTPHMDPLARGAFVGLTDYHTRGHLARAVMEGVTFALRQTLTISMNLAGDVSKAIIAGGGAESAVWRHIQADVYGLPLQQTLQPEQTCIGAAVLAGVVCGAYDSIAAGAAAAAQYGDIVEPDANLRQTYDDYYQQFIGLFPRLRDDFHQLTRRA